MIFTLFYIARNIKCKNSMIDKIMIRDYEFYFMHGFLYLVMPVV